MIGVTVSYRLEPKQHRLVPRKVEPRAPPQRRSSDRTARMLALAHYVEILVDEGRVTDYAAAARILGLTRARMTQVMNLLLLAPDIQKGLLLGRLIAPERQLRRVLQIPDWQGQRTPVASPDNGVHLAGGLRQVR